MQWYVSPDFIKKMSTRRVILILPSVSHFPVQWRVEFLLVDAYFILTCMDLIDHENKPILKIIDQPSFSTSSSDIELTNVHGYRLIFNFPVYIPEMEENWGRKY
jgi:hypothetical protein